MKTLGLIGGMSWESTALYYAALNRGIAARLGGLHSAKLLIANVDFHEVVEYQTTNNWDAAGQHLATLAAKLEAGGADMIALAVNTMHKVAPAIQAATSLPFIDIRSAVAKAIAAQDLRKVALLGTRYVVEQDFYADRMALEGGCTIIRPQANDLQFIHDAIYQELSLGEVKSSTRQRVTEIVTTLARQGAQGAVLACTELPMLQLQETLPDFPLIDSTELHVNACIGMMLS